MAESSANVLWRVRPAGAPGEGRTVTLERLANGIARGEVGDLDEVCGPGEPWQKVGEHPKLLANLPRPRWSIRKLEDDPEGDMTPMIDVTFQLLIFFMISATYVVQKTIDWPNANSDSASVQTLEELDKTHVLVEIMRDGTIHVDGKSTSPELLEDELSKAIRLAGSADVLLDVANEVQHELVVTVLDAAASAQAEQVLYVSRAASSETSRKTE